MGNLMKQIENSKSTLLGDNTQGLITTKQTSPSRSLLQHRIPSRKMTEISNKKSRNQELFVSNTRWLRTRSRDTKEISTSTIQLVDFVHPPPSHI